MNYENSLNVYDYDTLLHDINILKKKYSFLKISSIGKSVLGKKLFCIKIGNGEKKFIYSSGIHANEWISCKLLMQFLKDFCKSYFDNKTLYNKNTHTIYDNISLYIIPMLNPDTIDLLSGKYNIKSKEFMHYKKISKKFPNIPFPNGWKANFNGVDLNLQFPADWEQAKKIKFEKGFCDPSPRDFVGYFPLSEPESLALYDFTLKHNFDFSISLHSQGKEIYWNYQNINPPKGYEIGKILEKISGYKLTNVTYNSSFAGYKDWFILNYNKPSYTIEVGLGKNPLPLSQFDEIYNEIFKILVYCISIYSL